MKMGENGFYASGPCHIDNAVTRVSAVFDEAKKSFKVLLAVPYF